MAFGFKNLFAAFAALVFSAGHVACACLPDFSDASDSQIAEAAAHSHQAAGAARHHDHGGASGENGDGPFEGACDHCQLTQVAAAPDAAKLQAPKLAATPVIAIVSSVIAREAPTRFLRAVPRLRWAAPPGLSPVSLKNRLLI
ncbi:MAG TPA: hypothetical protein DDZ68_11365 [Parvularcula sp.]|jgi:hypothetical protein|nr:hypothetical protein [Parvularcula sp.]HBS36608.1 hypothetical protein [Parvularcula sp.]